MDSSIRFDEFSKNDTRRLFDLRNHPLVRQYMENDSELIYEDHFNWVNANLIENKNVILFFINVDGEDIGFILIKNIKKETAEMGIIIKDYASYTSLGPICGILFGDYIFRKYGLEKIFFKSLEHHSHSIKTMLKFGFSEENRSDDNNKWYSVTRQTCNEHKLYKMILSKFKEKVTYLEVK